MILKKARLLRRKLSRIARKRVNHAFRWWNDRVKKSLLRFKAKLWHKLYWFQHKLLVWKHLYGSKAFVFLLTIAIATSLYISFEYDEALASTRKDRIDMLGNIILALGGALIGATAIVSSLIMFAMQVNIERMPHGLFRKLSSDRGIFLAFSASFFLAVATTSLPLFLTKDSIGHVTLIAVWATIIVALLFVFSYRRALRLINPVEQLGILVKNTDREFQTWAKRAMRARPLLEPEKNDDDELFGSISTIDIARASYFRVNPHWTDSAHSAILHAISMSRQFAQKGDHEVSGEALKAVIFINQLYIKTKGKTFFSQSPFLDTGQSTDALINETLEQLRQNVQVAIARRDERQIEQNFRTFGALVLAYVQIDYAALGASKTHAHLAASYLANAVKSILPYKMPDVLMEGVRLQGTAAKLFLKYSKPDDIQPVVEELGLLAIAGVASKEYHPVTMASMEQFSQISLMMLQTRGFDIKFVSEDIRKNIVMAAQFFLAVPDTAFGSTHNTYLGPYYSGTSFTSFKSNLTNLVNAVAQADSDDDEAQHIISNIVKWSDGIYETEKELYLEAIKHKSAFVLTMIFWIEHLTALLISVSNATACSDSNRRELRKSALWLLATLNWVPDERESIEFVGNYDLTKYLFEAALKAHRTDFPDLTKDACKHMISWAVKAGKYDDRRRSLAWAICGVIVLMGMTDDENSKIALRAQLDMQLNEAELDVVVKERTAEYIRHLAATARRPGYGISGIERAMNNVDRQELTTLMLEIASDLVPPDNKIT